MQFLYIKNNTGEILNVLVNPLNTIHSKTFMTRDDRLGGLPKTHKDSQNKCHKQGNCDTIYHYCKLLWHKFKKF